MKRLTTILLVILSSCSISYKFNGASINYETTKTISVANFPIKAALVYPPLEELFTNSLKNAYTRQTVVEQYGACIFRQLDYGHSVTLSKVRRKFTE